MCQQDKVEKHQPRGLLEPLPIVKRPWESVTIDFIIGQHKSEGYGFIIVVVDWFSKYATFIAAPMDCTTEETTMLFDECLKHSSYTRVGSSFSHLFYSNFIVFVARSLIWCLVWLQVHWSVKSSFWKQFLEQ